MINPIQNLKLHPSEQSLVIDWTESSSPGVTHYSLVFSTDKDIRYYIMRWIEEQKVITPKSFNQWSVIPADWVKAASERDKALMFGAKNE